jgi:hypothetical protein
MQTFLVFLTASLAIACAGIVSVGIAWAARSGAPRSTSPSHETPRNLQQSMPAHAATQTPTSPPGQVEVNRSYGALHTV